MKSTLLLLFFFLLIGGASAQATSSKNYILVIAGKQFHPGDTIDRTFIKAVENSAIEIIASGSEKRKPISYGWAINLNHPDNTSGIAIDTSIRIWTGTCYINPPGEKAGTASHIGRCALYTLAELLDHASTGDKVFFQDFKFSPSGTTLHSQLGFFLR